MSKLLKVREIITLNGWEAGSGWSYQECYSDKIVDVTESDIHSVEMDWSWWETDIDNPPSDDDTLIVVELFAADADIAADKPLAAHEKWASAIWAARHAE